MLNALRTSKIVVECKRHTDEVLINDGDYQVHASNTDGIVTVFVFDTRDVRDNLRMDYKRATYNTEQPGWVNQVFKFLDDVDAVWGLRGSLAT